MKKILITALVLCLWAIAYARVDVAIGFNAGVPYYAEPPTYYDPNAEAVWMDAPVQVIMIDGEPHRMHMWHGHWYDESWRDAHRESLHDRNWDNDWHRGH